MTPGLLTRLVRGRRGAWVVAAVAFVNALAWGFITPPFHVPDEHKHVAYAEQIAVQGRPPRIYTQERPSPDLGAALRATEFYSVVFDARQKPPWSAAEDRAVQRDLGRSRAREGDAGAAGAASYPPLYYATTGLAAAATSSGSLLDRIAAMRVVSALFVAATVAFVFLFLAEMLPRSPWAWTLGALAVAFQPMLGFMGGGVNNDDGLFAAAAALFWLVARAFRVGVTPRLAALTGLVVALGFLAKPTMLALGPGAALGLLLAATRDRPLRSRPVVVAGVAFGAALAAPALVYLLANAVLWDRGGSVANAAVGDAGEISLSAGGLASYTWQFYLPRLPGMFDWQGGLLPLWEVWFQGWIGRFGWKDVEFPAWVHQVALGVVLVLLAALVVALVRRAPELRRRWREVVTFAAMALGTIAVIHAVGYRWLVITGTGFEQARYLLVLLPLYALGLVVAVRGFGRRLVPVAAPLVLVVAVAHALSGMLVTVARYYA